MKVTGQDNSKTCARIWMKYIRLIGLCANDNVVIFSATLPNVEGRLEANLDPVKMNTI